MPPEAHLTTPLLWMETSILVLLDAALILIVRRTIQREQFGRMRRLLPIAAGIFFVLVWTSAMVWAWDWFYIYIFPAWARFLLPPIFWMIYTLLGLGNVWLSLKLPGNPAVSWCVLGGVAGFLSHIYAIYGLGAVSKPPIMQGTNPLVVLIFSFFEITFYWSLILLASRVIWRVCRRE